MKKNAGDVGDAVACLRFVVDGGTSTTAEYLILIKDEEY